MNLRLNSIVNAAAQRGAVTFAALRHRNYRLWFVGQMISLMGTWMQSVAQQWLIYDLTDSKFALGAISFAASAPTLFLMIPAGALADRVPKRRILLITQTAMLLQAAILATLAVTGVLQVWHVGVLAFCLGIANSFDAPTRQSLAVEMVEDREDLTSAIAMNSMMFNVARIVGPSVGGIVLALLGPAWCFYLNALSFLAVLAALLFMRFPTTPPVLRTEPLTAQIGAGLRYIRGNVLVRTIIALVGMSNLFGFFYAILLPAFAADVLGVGASGLGWLQTAIGLGAVAGSLVVVTFTRSRYKGIVLIVGSLLFPVSAIVFAHSRLFPLSLCCLALAGFGFVAQNATSNTLVQTYVPDHLRGRVMGVYTLMLFGTTPFCSLMAGTLAQVLNPTWAVTIGSSITLLFAVTVALAVPALRRPDEARTTLIDLKPRLGDPAVRALLAEAVGSPTPERMEEVCGNYYQDTWHLLGLEEPGALVGCIGLEVTDPQQAVIQHIAVAPERRRHGIGRRILQQAAAMLGVTHLTAETDAGAVDFYRRCGFTVKSLGERYPGVERFLCTLEW
jgi:MFS family permease